MTFLCCILIINCRESPWAAEALKSRYWPAFTHSFSTLGSTFIDSVDTRQFLQSDFLNVLTNTVLSVDSRIFFRYSRRPRSNYCMFLNVTVG